MANLSTFQGQTPLKLLSIGDSGTGKTGALAALGMAGYKVRIMDFDKGIPIIIEALKKADRMDALANFEVVQLNDVMQNVGGAVIPKGVPQSYQDALKLLTYWGPKSHKEATELGEPAGWGLESFLVIDSLTHMCNAALRFTQSVSGNAGKNPTQPEWGTAQRMIEQMLTLIYSDDFATNVIINCHITYQGGKDENEDKVAEAERARPLQGFPMSLGKALSPKIPSFFNHMLIFESRGTGATTRRVITPFPNGVVQAKSPILVGLPKELPIETGLATYADLVLGKTRG